MKVYVFFLNLLNHGVLLKKNLIMDCGLVTQNIRGFFLLKNVMTDQEYHLPLLVGIGIDCSTTPITTGLNNCTN